MSAINPNNICLICGYDFGQQVRWDNLYRASQDICPCCDAQTGCDDTSLEDIRQWRAQWLAKGGKRLIPLRGKEWNREEQMKNIPPEYQ